ncbi:MAG: tail tape measure protein [Alphaproteobacteria bacterium]|nr:tail tape measure protein [Alphaproteobacteria bacterium]
MTDEIEALVLQVRADTGGFARDVETMRGQLEGPLASGADRAGRAMEGALARFVRTGKFGFDDLRRVAVSALDAIAAAALRQGGGGHGLLGIAGAVLSGLPGRATGGPVTGGRPYVVGERGPELFVPAGAGRIEPGALAAGGGRAVNVTVNVSAPRDASADFMRQTGAQVARGVRRALMQADG